MELDSNWENPVLRDSQLKFAASEILAMAEMVEDLTKKELDPFFTSSRQELPQEEVMDQEGQQSHQNQEKQLFLFDTEDDSMQEEED